MKKTRYSYFVFIMFGYYFSFGAFNAILSIYLAGIGKSPIEISAIVSAAGIFTIFIQPYIGTVFDRFQRTERTSAVCLLLSAVLGILFGLTKNTILLLLLNGSSMVLFNSIAPICEKLATGAPYSYGSIRIWGTLGYAIGSQVAGYVAEHSKARYNFYIFALGTLLTIIGFLLVERKTEGKDPGSVREMRKEGSQRTGKIFRKLLRNRHFLVFMAVTFLFYGSTTANNTYLPLLLQEVVEDISRVSTIIFAATLVEAPLIIASGKYMDRLSNKALLCMDFLIIIVQYGCYAFVRIPTVIVIMAILCKSSATVLYIMVNLKIVMNMVDDDIVNTALSVAASVKWVANVIMIFIAGFLTQFFRSQTAYAFFFVTSLIGLGISFFYEFPSKKKVLFHVEDDSRQQYQENEGNR